MNQKLKLSFHKKAYLQIDIAFALLIFTFFIFAIFTFYLSYSNNIDSINELNELNFESSQLCELLISNPGIPNNWEDNLSNLELIGLREYNSLNNSLSSSKISKFTNDNYLNITKNLNKDNIYHISLTGLNSNINYFNFGYNLSLKKSSIYTCYSNYNNEPVELIVEVWR